MNEAPFSEKEYAKLFEEELIKKRFAEAAMQGFAVPEEVPVAEAAKDEMASPEAARANEATGPEATRTDIAGLDSTKTEKPSSEASTRETTADDVFRPRSFQDNLYVPGESSDRTAATTAATTSDATAATTAATTSSTSLKQGQFKNPSKLQSALEAITLEEPTLGKPTIGESIPGEPTLEAFGWYVKDENLRESLEAFLKNLRGPQPNMGYLIVGPEKSGRTTLGCRMAETAQMLLQKKSDSVTPIMATDLDRRDIPGILTGHGIAYVEQASKLSELSIELLEHFLELPGQKPILFFEDTQEGMDQLKERAPKLMAYFTSQMNLPIWTDAQLATFGHVLADEMGYDIETMADLALHSRITALQTYYHNVNLEEVKDIILDAILTSKKNLMKKLIVRRSTLEARPQLQERDFKVR